MKKLIPPDAVLVPDGATRVFQGEIFGVYQWPQQLFDGSTDTFEMLKRPDTTSVICVVNNQIILLDEEQPHSGERLNFPGGRVDPEDADIVSAAKREVLEETGYTFTHWRLIMVKQPIKKMEWFIHYVIAWDVQSQHETAHEPGEKITPRLLEYHDLRHRAGGLRGLSREVAELIEPYDDIAALLDAPEFSGKAVNRPPQ